jgi:ribonucleoside-diphosphate reductase alpha chain
MKITRKFTKDGMDPFDSVRWTRRSSKISNPDGSVVFEMKDAEVPETWSQLATDIMVSKYFRKAGVPQMEDPCAIPGAGAGGRFKKDKDGKVVTGPERSARQVIHRLAGCWRFWGETHGYFDSAADAQAFYDELVYMMVHQMCAPNSPQWFNTGLNWRTASRVRPRVTAWSIRDRRGALATTRTRTPAARVLHSERRGRPCERGRDHGPVGARGAPVQVWLGNGDELQPPARRGRALVGGRQVERLMSWLKIGDRAASAIKSGGTTRRAAKMVCLDMDHPDIADVHELEGARGDQGRGAGRGDEAPEEEQQETASKLGLKLDYDFNGEAYQTVSGQNSNNSVRIPDSFFDAVDEGRRVEDHLAHQRQGSAGRSRRGSCGTTSATPRGGARIRACSSIRRSTRGTPARARADQREQPVLGVHVPRQHGVQPGVAERAEVLRPETRRLTSSGTSTGSTCGRSCWRSAC